MAAGLQGLLTPRNTVLGVLAGFLGVFLAGATMVPDYEVLHAFDARGLPCAKQDGKLENRVCGAFVTVSIGNTGRKVQAEVRVAWPIDTLRWNISESATDLVASSRVTPPPAFEWRRTDGGTLHVIRALGPNQVVDYKGVCTKCDARDLQELLRTGIVVEAQGTVVQADPRSSTFARAMRNLASVAMLGR